MEKNLFIVMGFADVSTANWTLTLNLVSLADGILYYVMYPRATKLSRSKGAAHCLLGQKEMKGICDGQKLPHQESHNLANFFWLPQHGIKPSSLFSQRPESSAFDDFYSLSLIWWTNNKVLRMSVTLYTYSDKHYTLAVKKFGTGGLFMK